MLLRLVLPILGGLCALAASAVSAEEAPLKLGLILDMSSLYADITGEGSATAAKMVKKPSESKAPWDYYKPIATVPAEEAFQPLAQSRCPLVKK